MARNTFSNVLEVETFEEREERTNNRSRRNKKRIGEKSKRDEIELAEYREAYESLREDYN